MTPKDGQILARETKLVEGISKETLDKLANHLTWGTFGRTGDKPMKVKTLNSLDTGHLENILITQKQIDFIYSKVILHILKQRYINGV